MGSLYQRQPFLWRHPTPQRNSSSAKYQGRTNKLSGGTYLVELTVGSSSSRLVVSEGSMGHTVLEVLLLMLAAVYSSVRDNTYTTGESYITTTVV